MKHFGAHLNPFLDAYCMPRQHLLDWQPQGPGLYALCADNRIYIGETENLADRLISSPREQEFGETIICFPLRSPGLLSTKKRRARLEADCISALQTFVWGHRTPLYLANRRHVAILETTAWRPDCPAHLTLAITTARTILHAMAMPLAWSGLPGHGMFLTTKPQNFNALDDVTWSIIRHAARHVREERYRQAVELTGSPRYSLVTVFDQLRAEDFVARLACMAGDRSSGHFGAGLIS